MKTVKASVYAGLLMAGAGSFAHADENLWGYVSGAETLPQGANEAYAELTSRNNKGIGTYDAYNLEIEYERGITSRLSGSVGLQGQAIDTKDIFINAYVPGSKDYGMKPSGVEGDLKFMFLSPAKDPVGLSGRLTVEHSWLDPHSGQDKDTTSVSTDFQVQKYFLDDQLVAVANGGIEATYAKRDPIANLPPDFEWPTDPEMEIELTSGVGLSYRVAPGLFIGAETLHITEFETTVGQERESWHAGPSIHYAQQRWWTTVT